MQHTCPEQRRRCLAQHTQAPPAALCVASAVNMLSELAAPVACQGHGPAGVAPNSPLTAVPPALVGGEGGRPSRYSWLMDK